MELDRHLLEQISLLDDDTLAATIKGVAQSMGMNPALTSMYLTDMSKVKSAVQNLTQSDLDRITDAFGEETTEKLVENIRREVKGE
jgi:hypothetical protein